MRKGAVLALAVLCSGCVTTDVVTFQARKDQQAMMRDGRSALASRRANSLVVIRSASRELNAGGRPVFVVGINNLGRQPLDFKVSQVDVTQIVNGQATPLRVITYEDLVREEKTRQVFQAVLAGAAAGANAYSASQAGRYSSSSTVVTPRGAYNVRTVGYSPTANAIAQANASAQNEAMISATIEQGQANLANLENGVIKDNTLMPGEWYGGQLHLQPLVSSGSEQKNFTIVINVGSDRHEIEITQGPPK